MKRIVWLTMVGLALGTLLAGSVALAEKEEAREFIPRGPSDPMLNPALPMIMIEAGDTAWVNVHLNPALCPGSPNRGGEARGGPGPLETWCFEGGGNDTASIGPMGAGTHNYYWTHFDRRTYRDDFDSSYWHATTFHSPTSANMSMWCGGFNNRCFTWDRTTGGYGNFWNQIMQLDLPVCSVARGCSVAFRSRYIVECNYDYAYIEYYSFKNAKWRVIDTFNGKGGCVTFAQPCAEDWNNYPKPDRCPTVEWSQPVNYPQQWRGQATAPRDNPEYPYVPAYPGQQYVLVPGDSIATNPLSTPLRLRWRFTTDALWSAEEPGQNEAKGFWVDDVVVKWDGIPPANTFLETFDLVPENGQPGPPWSFPPGDAVHDGWAVRYDLDPPYEGFFAPGPGDSGIPSTCDVNASWQWSVTPTGTTLPPSEPPEQGLRMFMVSPAVPMDYVDPELGAHAQVGVVFQYDEYMYMDPQTCDYTDTKVRVHRSEAPGWDPNGAWCPWENIDDLVFFGGGTFWNLDLVEDVTAFTSQAGLDSVQFCWSMIDVGEPGDACWDPTLPPHKDVQFVVDNVSIGLVDGSTTRFTIAARTFNFQDTFNVHSCMHTSNVANNDLGYGTYFLHDESESLNITVTDPDGITEGNVELKYSYNGVSGPWNTVTLVLAEPDELDPTIGGVFRGTICDTPWTPGTEISYYIYAKDDLLNEEVFPAGADPSNPNYPLYPTVSILPTPGARILFVDDFGRNRRDYSPCRYETTTLAVEDFYTDILEDLGYGYQETGGYDKYDVNDASSNQRNMEPWGYWTADPGNPSEGYRQYDIVIWTTGPYFDTRTISDTTQAFLTQFVFNGGKLLMTGDRIGQNLNDPDVEIIEPDFYPYVLGANFLGTHPDAFLDSDRFPTCSAVDSVHQLMNAGDSLHLYSGCDIIRQPMDKITISTEGVPEWSHPGAYLIYNDVGAPYDSVAGIYNVVTSGDSVGQVVYIPFSLEAVVDSTTTACDPPPGTAGGQTLGNVGFGVFQGRASLLVDVLMWFGEGPWGASVSPRPADRYANALNPVQPNPFNPETNVSFSLASRGRVELVVYDVLGRQVKTLVDEVREAGPHMVRWDGRNAAGHPVASGLYFARMETESFTATEKMTLLK